MSIAKDFNNFFDRKVRNVATILNDYGANRYEAQLESGAKLILLGEAAVNEKVFYNVKTLKIIEKAPNITFVNVPV